MRISTILLLYTLTACTIVDEELRIANELIIIRMENDKPKVRVATGLEDCKWRAKVEVNDLSDGEHELHLQCAVSTNLIKPY